MTDDEIRKIFVESGVKEKMAPQIAKLRGFLQDMAFGAGKEVAIATRTVIFAYMRQVMDEMEKEEL